MCAHCLIPSYLFLDQVAKSGITRVSEQVSAHTDLWNKVKVQWMQMGELGTEFNRTVSSQVS